MRRLNICRKLNDIDINAAVQPDIFIYPESATIERFLNVDPGQVLLSMAFCLKSIDCKAGRYSERCASDCADCQVSAILRMARELAIDTRIEASNDDLMRFLDDNGSKYQWIISIACPFEIRALSPLLWKKYALKQIVFPLLGGYCRSPQDKNLRRGKDSQVKLWFPSDIFFHILRLYANKAQTGITGGNR